MENIIETLKGVTFRSATEAGRIAKQIIADQPGYRRGQLMAIAKATTGGLRLYTRVGDKWMDASLSDI